MESFITNPFRQILGILKARRDQSHHFSFQVPPLRNESQAGSPIDRKPEDSSDSLQGAFMQSLDPAESGYYDQVEKNS